ncbi:hypothetical protein CATMIT_01560, partial [Catenibacterium mitsuokai DSM 15897]
QVRDRIGLRRIRGSAHPRRPQRTAAAEAVAGRRGHGQVQRTQVRQAARYFRRPAGGDAQGGEEGRAQGHRPVRIETDGDGLNSSGTTLGDKVLIGAELAGGGPDTDVSEMPEPRQRNLRNYFATRPADGLPLLLVHEHVHTQQKGPGPTLLAQAIYEGAADFVAERATGKLPPLDYVRYGRQNEARLKRDFRA